MTKTKNGIKYFRLNIVEVVLIIITVLTKGIHYLWYLANDNIIYYLIMDSVCRVGLLVLFMFIGYCLAIKALSFREVIINSAFYYITIGGGYLLFDLLKSLYTNTLTLKHFLIWCYEYLVGKQGFIWVLLALFLCVLVMSFLLKLTNIKGVLIIAIIAQFFFLILEPYSGLVLSQNSIIFKIYMLIFRDTRNPFLFAFLYIVIGYIVGDLIQKEKLTKKGSRLIILLNSLFSILWLIELSVIYIGNIQGDQKTTIFGIGFVGTLFIIITNRWRARKIVISNKIIVTPINWVTSFVFLISGITINFTVPYFANSSNILKIISIFICDIIFSYIISILVYFILRYTKYIFEIRHSNINRI